MHPDLTQRLLRDTNPVAVLSEALVIASHLARAAKDGEAVLVGRQADAPWPAEARPRGRFWQLFAWGALRSAPLL